MKSLFISFYEALIAIAKFFQPVFLLIVRLFWGWQFFKTGLDKLGDLNSIANYFASLNIPAPHFNAVMAAITETVGGLFLMLGFAARLISLPLIVTMIVALLTAHAEATQMIWDDPTAFVTQTPFTFLLASLIILFFGPGVFSIDAILKKWHERSGRE